ncbi:hypothetical protein KEG38_54535 [Polyangium jinanense]|uniref:DUF6687 family protein n=1 Tax=Polyangium jinanense TaxID=2829994 RepID=UPI00233FDE88|nr:DUF6687 family protein [Polyangium jinanense]MDC3962942.1 hypothetical protein [Polyangium jinanense]
MAARQFQFVPMGERAPEGAVSCDGLVAGAALDLSHWAKNRTPKAFKADTSVEIALSFVREASPAEAPTVVVNNHFDADGVLAVWSLLDPETATAHAELIVAAAEAGDFEEWPADTRGLWLNMAIRRLVVLKPEASAYPIVLASLGELVRTLESREDLWGTSFSALLEAERRANAGDVVSYAVGPIRVFHHGPGVPEAPGAVLSKLGSTGEGVRRLLLAFEEPDGSFRYRYELPRWAWADTVVRPVIPAPSRNALAAGLGPAWAMKGVDFGMTALLRTTAPIREEPRAMAERFVLLERFEA